MSFTLWKASFPLFYSSTPLTGALWQKSNDTNGGNPIWVDSETNYTSYSATTPSTYNIYLTSQDWTGATQNMIPVASVTEINPFGKYGNIVGAATLSSNATTGSGLVFWWSPGSTANSYTINAQNYNTTYVTSPSAGPNTTLTGNVIQPITNFANPTDWSTNWNSSTFVMGISQSATATTENIWFQAFNTSGVATTPLTEVAAGVNLDTQWFVGYSSSKNNFTYVYTVDGSGVFSQSFDTTTGSVGSAVNIVSQNYSTYYGLSRNTLVDGSHLNFTEGVLNGSHVLQVTDTTSSNTLVGVTDTITLPDSSAVRWRIANGIYDPTTGTNDYTALAYVTQGTVHLDLFGPDGKQVGSDFVVPGLTSFERIITMGTRVEIDYLATTGTNSTDEYAVIYDTATQGRTSTLSGGGEYVGTPMDDVFNDAAGTYYIVGGGGTDTLNTSWSSGQVNITTSNGNIVVATPTSSDTLQGFSRINLLNQTISISGTTWSARDKISVSNDFTNAGYSDILFRNSSGTTYLWTMNGGTVSSGATTSVQVGNNWQIKGIGDFNGDGNTDILWVYNNTSNTSDALNGVSYVSMQSGATSVSGSGVVEQLSTDWQVAGVGDFNGDGMSDVLYRNATTGQTYLNVMNGASINWSASGFTSQQVTDPNWQIVATGDFNGDGKKDILWQYNNTSNASDALNGTLYEWQMNGTTVQSANLLSQQAGANWTVAGTGDFDGDGHSDILFRYENTKNASDPLNGVTYIDFMNGSTVSSGAATQWQIDNSWVVASIGDFNGDGKSDILWQQTTTGNTYVWEMNGANVVAGVSTSQQAGNGWTVQNGVHVG